MRRHWSVRETEERVRRRLHEAEQRQAGPDERRLYYQEASRTLSAQLGRRAVITPGKKKGKLVLEYYDDADLESLLAALNGLPREGGDG